jgi:MATE family multidrug resistance protein
MTIPFSIIFFFTEDILLILQQKPVLAKLAGEFSRYSIPAILPVFLWRATERYLQGQKILYPGVIVGVVGFLLNIGFNYFFIYICNFGFKGSAIATTTSRCLQIILYWTIIFWKGLHKGTNDTIHKEAFTINAIASYLKLGLPNAIWFFLESMGWNIITVIVGATLKDEYAIDAHMITLNIMIVSFIPTLAWCTSTGTRVGNLIGEKRPFNAKFSSNIYITFSTTITILTSIAIIVARDYIIRFWTSDPKVSDTTRVLFIYASVLILFDAFQSVISSVLRAIGRQAICAVTTLGYWVIGIPLGLILFKYADLGIYSFYWSLGISLTVNSIVIIIYYLKIDWEEEVIRAFDRMNDINKNSITNNAEGKEELKYLVNDKSESMSITIEDSESSLNENN